MLLISDLVVILIRFACFTNFLEIEGVNICFFIHQMIAISSLDLNASVPLTFMLNNFCHLISTEILVI